MTREYDKTMDTALRLSIEIYLQMDVYHKSGPLVNILSIISSLNYEDTQFILILLIGENP